jgi:hypothetical protein
MKRIEGYHLITTNPNYYYCENYNEANVRNIIALF